MSKFYDQVPAGSDGLMRRLQALEREVQELRAARRLEAASIGRGGITIEGGAIVLKDANGIEIGRLGAREDLPNGPDGRPQSGFILRRTDGTKAFTIDDPNGDQDGVTQSQWALYDGGERRIFAEDAGTGFGLAAPQFSYNFNPSVDHPRLWVDLPNESGNVFRSYWVTFVPIFHSRYRISLIGQTFPGTTGGTSPTAVIRVLADGVSLGTKTVPQNASPAQLDWDIDGKALSGGDLGKVVKLEVQAYKATTLTGTSSIAPWYFFTM